MTISVTELHKKLANQENFHLIDVREIYEYEENKIPNAVNLPLGDIANQNANLPEDKNSEIIVQCRSGHRSGMAQQILMQQGYTNVKNLTGGILAWMDAGY